MNTVSYVPLIDGNSIQEIIDATNYQSSEQLKKELIAWGIDCMGINFDFVDQDDMSLLKKFIMNEILREKKFDDYKQRSSYFDALSQEQINTISQKIQAYINWYWRPKYTMRTL
jgi:hypothetical protein